MKISNAILAVTFSLLTLASCNKVSNGQSAFDCISGFEDFAYYDPSDWEYSNEKILPPKPWEMIIELPKDPNAAPYPYEAPSVEITRVMKGQPEIWILRKLNEGVSQHNEIREFYIYKPNTHELQRISAEIEGVEIWVDKLYVASDGSIWGRNIWSPADKNLSGRIPALSKFNEISKRFEFDNESVEIQLQLEPNKGVIQAEIILDRNDVFWIFIPNEGLFRYEPALPETRKILDWPDNIIGEATLAPDGSIFFMITNYQIGLQEGEIKQFIPETETLISLEIPDEPWPSLRNLLVDSKGRLWIGSIGWREPDGTWNLMYPNPKEYFEKVQEVIYWSPPKIILESSNGYLWFDYFTYKHKGVAWYDPSTEEGCWFTTEDSEIIEDQNQNLWMVVDGKLYKYALNS